VKVWDIKDYRPTHVFTMDLKLGHILCASFCPDVPLVVAVGGQKNGLKVRNLAETAQVQKHFQSREHLIPVTTNDSDNSKRKDIKCQDSLLTRSPPTLYPDQLEDVHSLESVTSSLSPKHVQTCNSLTQKKKKKKQRTKTRNKQT
jgi:hypothetical protein